MYVVIIGARERKESDEDKKHVKELIRELVAQHGSRLIILSVGCDKGVGKVAREFCMDNKVVFIETRIKFEGEDIKRQVFAHAFLARNLVLINMGDEFYVYRGTNENGIIESLIEPAKAKVGAQRVHEFGA